jgi:hypothetical protein
MMMPSQEKRTDRCQSLVSMGNLSGIAFSTFPVHSILAPGLSVRVIMRRLVAVLLAWMDIILVNRAELRNHRKLSVIDGEVVWTGSQNLVDPRFFKQDEDVGQWVDDMFRIDGPVVEAPGGCV